VVSDVISVASEVRGYFGSHHHCPDRHRGDFECQKTVLQSSGLGTRYRLWSLIWVAHLCGAGLVSDPYSDFEYADHELDMVTWSVLTANEIESVLTANEIESVLTANEIESVLTANEIELELESVVCSREANGNEACVPHDGHPEDRHCHRGRPGTVLSRSDGPR